MIDTELAKTNKRYHESFWKKLLNKLLVAFLILISYLPFWVIYGISDFLYLLIRYVIKYRKKVILKNLTFAFPEKTENEIKTIVGKFYHHFCDLSLETIKMYRLNKKQIKKRIQFKGLDIFEKYYQQGKSIIVLGMHHNNWEWCCAVQKHIQHQALLVYNPIRGNQAFEKYLTKSREQWGGICVPVHKSARTVFKFSKQGKPTGLWLGADQTPQPTSQFWTVFLNREAPFFSGPEKIAKKTNQPVLFHRIKKLKRGVYEHEFIPLFEHPQKVNETDILLGYVSKMEEIILEDPEYYLWSHRRWKHKRPEGIKLVERE